MIVYSTVPVEKIFEDYDKMQLNYQEINYGHLTMVVEQVSDSEGRIVRLISPLAQDYLNPEYQPGTKIQFRPNFGE